MADLNEYWQDLLAKFGDLISGKAPVLVQVADPDDITSISEPAANTAAVITFAAPGAGLRWIVKYISGFYTGGAPTLQQLTVESPAATFKLRYPMGTTADAPKEPLNGGEVHGAANTAVVVTLPAGGAAVSGKLYATAIQVRESAA